VDPTRQMLTFVVWGIAGCDTLFKGGGLKGAKMGSEGRPCGHSGH